MVTIWEDLMRDNFRVIQTPKGLVRQLKKGRREGQFI